MNNIINLSEISDLPLVDESIESVGRSTKNYLKQYPAYLLAGAIFLTAYYVVLFIFNIQAVGFYVLPITFMLWSYLYLLDRVRHEFMRQFAVVNNFSYSKKGTLDDLDGALFQIGRSKSVYDVVNGQYRGAPVILFTYTYVTGSGKSSQIHNFTVFKFELGSDTLNIFLKNKNHEFGESLFNILKGKISLQLEGDFNKYFSLMVPKEYEIEALQILSPNIMADLEDKCHSLSLEIVNNHIYIYKNSVVNTKKDLYSFYECAKYFGGKLAPVLSRIKPS